MFELQKEHLAQLIPGNDNVDGWHEALVAIMPKYGIKVEEARMSNYKEFFNKSFLDEVELKETKLSISKKYSDPLFFEFIDFGDVVNIKDNIDGKFDIMESYPEILFLTKYIGDYNISKYGDKLVFENKDKGLVLKRI